MADPLKTKIEFWFRTRLGKLRKISTTPPLVKTRFFLRNFFLRVLTQKVVGFGGRFLLQDRSRSFLMALPIV